MQQSQDDISKLAEVYKEISTKRIEVVNKLKHDHLTSHLEKLKSVFLQKKTWLTEDELNACQTRTHDTIRGAIRDKLAEIADEVGQKKDEKTLKCLQKYNQDLVKCHLESSTAIECASNAFERLKELNIRIWDVQVFPENIAFIAMALGESHALMQFWCSYKSWAFMVRQVQDQDCDGGILSAQLYFHMDNFKQEAQFIEPLSLHCDLRCQNTGKKTLELLLDFLDNYKTVEEYADAHYKVRMELPRVLESRGVEISKVDFKWTFTKLKLGNDVGFRFYYPDEPKKCLWVKVANYESNKLFVSSSKYGSYDMWRTNKVSGVRRNPDILCLSSGLGGRDTSVEHLLTEESAEDMADQIIMCLNHFTGRFGFPLEESSWFNGSNIDPMIDQMLVRISTRCQTPNLLEIVKCAEGSINLKTGLVINHVLKFNLYDHDHLIGGSFVKSNRLPWIQLTAYLVGRVESNGTGLAQGYIQVKLMQAIGQAGELDSHFEHYDESQDESKRILDNCNLYQEIRSVNLDAAILNQIRQKHKENKETRWGENKDVSLGLLQEFAFSNPDPRVTAKNLLDQVETIVCKFFSPII